MSQEEKMNTLLGFFDKFVSELKKISNPYKGDERFKPFSFEEILKYYFFLSIVLSIKRLHLAFKKI